MSALVRRCVHTSTDDTRRLLRQLLRQSAQSVAVVTAVLPDRTSTFHGATLSSFSSIALDPLPLVAFSLRVPSRMASALSAHVASQTSPDSAHLIINILSAAQPHLAERFARPDCYPRPFADPSVSWSHSNEGLPILSGVLGALSCRLVGPSMPLTELGGSHVEVERVEKRGDEEKGGAGVEREAQQPSRGMGLPSELFIARVLRIEKLPCLEDDSDGLYKLPLLYHRRRYTTVRNDT